MSAVDTKFYEKKKQRTFYVALGLVVFVVLSSVALYFYTQHISDSVQENQQETGLLQLSIDEISKEENIKIYSVYSQHKDLLEKLTE